MKLKSNFVGDNLTKQSQTQHSHFCNRCFHQWVSSSPKPSTCADCRSPYWNKQRKRELKEQQGFGSDKRFDKVCARVISDQQFYEKTAKEIESIDLMTSKQMEYVSKELISLKSRLEASKDVKTIIIPGGIGIIKDEMTTTKTVLSCPKCNSKTLKHKKTGEYFCQKCG